MDRTMYGKVDPGARNPYRCIREKGISPGCKFYNNCLNQLTVFWKKSLLKTELPWFNQILQTKNISCKIETACKIQLVKSNHLLCQKVRNTSICLKSIEYDASQI